MGVCLVNRGLENRNINSNIAGERKSIGIDVKLKGIITRCEKPPTVSLIIAQTLERVDKHYYFNVI